MDEKKSTKIGIEDKSHGLYDAIQKSRSRLTENTFDQIILYAEKRKAEETKKLSLTEIGRGITEPIKFEEVEDFDTSSIYYNVKMVGFEIGNVASFPIAPSLHRQTQSMTELNIKIIEEMKQWASIYGKDGKVFPDIK